MEQTRETIRDICIGVVIALILVGTLAHFMGLRITTKRELDRTDVVVPSEQIEKT